MHVNDYTLRDYMRYIPDLTQDQIKQVARALYGAATRETLLSLANELPREDRKALLNYWMR